MIIILLYFSVPRNFKNPTNLLCFPVVLFPSAVWVTMAGDRSHANQPTARPIHSWVTSRYRVWSGLWSPIHGFWGIYLLAKFSSPSWHSSSCGILSSRLVVSDSCHCEPFWMLSRVASKMLLNWSHRPGLHWKIIKMQRWYILLFNCLDKCKHIIAELLSDRNWM
jgi:hypothetical protein